MSEFAEQFVLPVVPRYAEIDQQGVVFNGHYLTWFDEASTGLLSHLGFGYPDLMAAGYDLQVVHTELDFLSPVRWRDTVRVSTGCIRVGATSTTIGFSVRASTAGAEERVAVAAHIVYVVVSSEDWTKRPVPDELRSALRLSGPFRAR